MDYIEKVAKEQLILNEVDEEVLEKVALLPELATGAVASGIGRGVGALGEAIKGIAEAAGEIGGSVITELGGPALLGLLAAPPLAGYGIGRTMSRVTSPSEVDWERLRLQHAAEEYDRQQAKMKELLREALGDKESENPDYAL
jgi:hypothetical protein